MIAILNMYSMFKYGNHFNIVKVELVSVDSVLTP